MGETRSLRLYQFHEENDTPVVALPEGGLLLVEGDTVTARGLVGPLLFQQGKDTQELSVGEDLSALLEGEVVPPEAKEKEKE